MKKSLFSFILAIVLMLSSIPCASGVNMNCSITICTDSFSMSDVPFYAEESFRMKRFVFYTVFCKEENKEQTEQLLSSLPYVICAGHEADLFLESVLDSGFFTDWLKVTLKDGYNFNPEDFENTQIKNYIENGKNVIELFPNIPSPENLLCLKHKIDNKIYTEKTELYVFDTDAGLYLTEPFIVGDADNSGDLTSSDARFILRLSVGINNNTFRLKYICDTDGDGLITSQDARFILRCSVKLEETKKGIFPL